LIRLVNSRCTKSIAAKKERKLAFLKYIGYHLWKVRMFSKPVFFQRSFSVRFTFFANFAEKAMRTFSSTSSKGE